MNARMTATLSLLLAACAACASTPSPPGDATASSADSPRRILRPSECLDPAMARSWTDIGRDTLLVDAGRHKYRMEVSGACSAVTWSPVLVFRGDPVSGRVCGSVGDAIVTRDYPCTIQRLELLDKVQYKALLQQYEDARKRRRDAKS